MIEIFTVSSLFLGLAAWTLPIVNIMLTRRKKKWNWGTLATLSLSACAISMWFLYLYTNHKVNVEDWSAILDTTGAITRVTGVLLMGTLLLNLVTYFVYRKKSNL